MAMVGDFVVRKAFKALYAGVEELIRRNLIFKSLFKEIKSSLDSLKPLIQEMSQHNQQLDCSRKELEALDALMKDGVELVTKCLEINRWNAFKKFKYANQLSQWDYSLGKQLKILSVQGIRDGKKTAVSVGNIEVSVGNIEVELKNMKEEFKEEVNQIIEANRATQNQSAETNAWCAVPELPKLTVGLDVPLKELKMKFLEDDKVPMLVVTAPGGCGKTTLATKFCQDQQVKEKFGGNIFFVTVSQKGNLELIVKQMYKHKDSEVPTFRNEVHVAQWLNTFFMKVQSPLLLVLDDVWSGSESILEYFQFEMTHYKILVTSRSEFPRFGSSYHLPLLDDENAMELFRHLASLGDKISYRFEELSRKIIKHCNGFPLALTVVGRSLCKQPIEIWRKRVTEWSKGSSILDSETNLLLCLKSSLDALDNDMAIVKECFLDLGSFPEDEKICVATLIDMWAELYDLDEDTLCFANVYVLNNRSLATLVNDSWWEKIEGQEYYDENYVKQHDLLRELAIYHAKLDPVEHRKRVNIDICGNNLPKWWREQKHQPMKARLLSISSDREFSMDWPYMQLPEAEVLVLDFQTKYYALPGFVEKMDKLKVLVVHGRSPQRAELSNFELLGLLPNLKRITLRNILTRSIIKNPIQLKSLRNISLYFCDIGQALNNKDKMSDAFPNLEEMNIHLCINSGKLLAEICDLVHLKKLSIINCQEVCALPEEIENLVNLQVLRLRFCSHLLKLPGSITNLKKLNFLDLAGCMEIKELPENMGEMNSLRKLDIRICDGLQNLPKSVLNLDQLEEVICDSSTNYLWEPFLPFLKNIRLVVVQNYLWENVNFLESKA